jgi:hypothetical protein
METWSYEGFTDREQRALLTRIRGFCSLHTWQLAQRNSAFQLAVVYENILSEMEHDLAREQTNSSQESSDRNWLLEIKHLLQPGGSVDHTQLTGHSEQCPFCQIRTRAEQRLIERLVPLLQTEQMPSLLRQSTGVCRLHYMQATQYMHTRFPACYHILVECQQACVQRVLAEVRELIRKHDYRFQQESHGEEMTAWRRAAELCAGNPGVR